jgi:peptidyl-prolyl cis-trans isomerase B (cyclophilin B)
MSTVPPRPSPEPSRPSGPGGPFGRNGGIVLIVVGVVVAVIVGFVSIGLLVGDSTGTTTNIGYGGTPTPTTPPVTSNPPPGHTVTPPSTTPPSVPALHCLPAPPLPKSPEQFAKPPSPELSEHATWRATLTTNCGDIVIDLDGKLAPQTVASFIFLSQQKFYDDVPCHRLVTSGIYVLQCGDPTGTGSGGPGYEYGLENAPADGDYPTGSVAMARTQDPNSNGSQFFIVYADTQLPAPGYSIFGKVVSGLPLVQAIAANGIGSDGVAPAQPISIISSTVKKL